MGFDMQASWRIITHERKRRGCNKTELAALMGTSTSSVSRMDRQGYYPSLDGIVRLADAWDVSVDYLLGRVQQAVS